MTHPDNDIPTAVTAPVVDPGSTGPGEDRMDITTTLDALAEVIATARPRALGGGAIIDKDAAAQLVEQARAVLPEEIRQAQGILAERDAVIAEAQAEVEQMRSDAREYAQQLVAQDEITRAAHAEADRIVIEAQGDGDRKRAEADAYVDAKLASFEGTLQRTMEAVQNGRQKLAGAMPDIEQTPVA